jgi:hypothetical protein
MRHGRAMGEIKGWPFAATKPLIEPNLATRRREERAPTNIPPMQRIVAQPMVALPQSP